MSMESANFRLEDVMDNLANLVGLKAEDKGIELLFNAAPDVPTALIGDPLRLGQILINLGNNAVKFTESGEIIVGVEKVSEDTSGVELHFWVKDTGIGMTPEQCSKMFQSFSQADASTTRKYGGTGLGLAISKNLVELMQGRIWVESKAGEGSIFHFHARFGMQVEPMPRRMFHAEELQGLRVLVTDDNASAREILSTMSRSFGLCVDTASDGTQAIEMVLAAEEQSLPYNLVLMDWKMPHMDGIAAVDRIRHEQLTQIPAVIMVTAYGRDEALTEAANRHIDLGSVLTKPVTASTLLEAIGEALGTSGLTETRAQEKVDSHKESMHKLQGARVLLVEDNEMNQELALELLANAGMTVVVANNGQEALDILASDPQFDGILMDCQMPVMDGYTATRHIRANPQIQHLPIIAMTANAMAGDREKVLEAGMLDHIAKPLNVGEMFATIARWITPANPADKVTTTFSEERAAPHSGNADLPGINQKAGLATAMGNEKLYQRLLVKFRDSQKDFATQFKAAQSDPDPQAATRAAHTLKGTAGNIGAQGVQAAAAALEHACVEQAGMEEIQQLLDDVMAALEPVITGLASIGESSHPPAEKASSSVNITLETLQPQLEELRRLLEDSDTEASDVVEAILEKIKGSDMERLLRRVGDEIAGYDFDAALDALNALS